MKTLPPIELKAEQLHIVSENRLGVEIIRGAAGSGKTSTALLRLRSLAYMFAERHNRMGIPDPVEILVLTFNRTLAGYVRELAEGQVGEIEDVSFTIDTFGRWARNYLQNDDIVEDGVREQRLRRLSDDIPLSSDYVRREVDYVLGRFRPDELEQYIAAERTGRGTEPRVDRALRRRLLDEVIYPYKEWLRREGLCDWNDLAFQMSQTQFSIGYDVAIVDECQDFSANQLRAIRHHIAEEHSVTFVIDTFQRIYARGFTWRESGFDMREENARYYLLTRNYRNTAEIAAFAAGILEGMDADPDGALPNLNGTIRNGDKPVVLRGKYHQQVEWCIQFIRDNIDLDEDTVAFLKPQGGRWFSTLKKMLDGHNFQYVNLTREPDWPMGPENIALSTFHSAKGLEFDHVFIIGLNDENTANGEVGIDDQIFVLRRLLAVAVARARETLVIGYKSGEESELVGFFKDDTFEDIAL